MTGSEHPGNEHPRSVFGAPDQREIIARLDSVDVDDEDSTFFGVRSQDTAAAQEAFAEGISTFGGVEVPRTPAADPAPSVSPAPPVSPAPSVSPTPSVSPAPAHQAGDPPRDRAGDVPAPPPSEDLGLPLTDPDAISAFILGGPAAIQQPHS